MKKNEDKIAELLLQSKAIKLQPTNPFTWASGWKSPIYCDNRITLSFPDIRKEIKNCFCEMIKTTYPDTEVIAGVATGAIAQAALVAEAMNLPLIYVRPEAKKHGMGNQIEGKITKGAKVVVIEDLVSTGMSSLNAVEALRKNETNVLGMIAIFTYGFEKAEDNFVKASCKLDTLSNYNRLIEIAAKTNYISSTEIETLNNWRNSPSTWMQ